MAKRSRKKRTPRLPAPPVVMASGGDPLDEVALAVRQVDQAQAALLAAVVAARGAGYSWTPIGRALGVTRQSARERFAASVSPS